MVMCAPRLVSAAAGGSLGSLKQAGRRALRRRDRGFTLAELVIVATLISLFSTLAVFSIQTQFQNNQRKAVIAETRQIAAALEFANLDTGIFPKLCFLDQSRDGLLFLGVERFGAGGGGFQIYNYMDVAARRTFDAAPAIDRSWRGPYFALSQARRGLAQGRGGFAQVVLNESGWPTTEEATLRYPTDVYGNPYVVYMMNADLTNQQLLFVQEGADGLNPTKKGTFVNAVVSYGPNQVPGGDERFRANFTSPLNGVGLRLYTGNPAEGRFTSLDVPQYTRARASAWALKYATALGTDTQLAPNFDNTGRVGITDPTSDDVVFEF